MTGGQITGNKRSDSVPIGEGILFDIEAQFRLAMFFVGAVTKEAFCREDGPDVATKIDRFPGGKNSERK